ncbi:MAG: HD domain-containing protein [Bdellovibrio sp.]|nr:HD domain-containing protein [Bdellovibrio sp.]
MKFLYIEPDQDIRDIYAMKLEADFCADIIAVSDEKEALERYQEQCKNGPNRPDLALVLLDAGVASTNFQALYDFFNKLHKIPFLLLYDGDSLMLLACLDTFLSDHAGNRTLKKPFRPEVFRKTVHECLSSNNNNFNWVKNAENGHNKVKIQNFLKFNSLPCDVFIRLNDMKFVKLLNANDMYTTEVIQKYIDKDVRELYVHQEDYPVLANTGLQNLISLYDRKSEFQSIQELNLESLENIHRAIQEIGLSTEAVTLTTKTIISSVRLAKGVRSIADLLNKMKSSGNYIYDHSMKMSYICTAIAKHTEWGSDSTVFKLSLACTMHDMTLNNDDLARIELLTDPRLKIFTSDEIEAFKNHPQDAAKLIKDSKAFPSDVDFIVAQHHERPDGSGFPHGLLKLRIAPLSCVFILAHEFVNRIEELGNVYNLENRDRVYQALSQEMYTRGNFKKPFEGLRRAFNLAPKNINDT